VFRERIAKQPEKEERNVGRAREAAQQVQGQTGERSRMLRRSSKRAGGEGKAFRVQLFHYLLTLFGYAQDSTIIDADPGVPTEEDVKRREEAKKKREERERERERRKQIMLEQQQQTVPQQKK
jgi:hypothetical protein